MLWSRLSSRISLYFGLPVPAAEKQHDAVTTMLHRRDVGRFLPDVTLGIQTKVFSLGFIRPDNLVAHGLRVFRCLLANSKRALMWLMSGDSII